MIDYQEILSQVLLKIETRLDAYYGKDGFRGGQFYWEDEFPGGPYYWDGATSELFILKDYIESLLRKNDEN